MKLSTMTGILTAVTLLGLTQVMAETTGDVELLNLVANGYKSNFERIRTLSGAATITTIGNYQDDPTVTVELGADVAFAYDCDRGAKRWNYVYVSAKVTTGDGKTTERPRGSDYQNLVSAMFKDGAFYRYNDYDLKRHENPQQAQIRHAENANVSNFSEDFDPVFFHSNRGLGVDEDIRLYVTHWDDPELNAAVRREGDIVILETNTPQSKAICKYDLAKGCNLVEMELNLFESEAQVDLKFSWEWREAEGVFTVARYTELEETRYVGNPAANTAQTREVVFHDVKVNEPLPESEFTLAALGVKPGDRIVDNRTGVSYVYGAPDSEKEG